MNQSCFSLGFFSQNSLWKLSTFRAYKGLYIVWWEGMRKVSFSQTWWFGDLASRLDWVASSSRELTAWPTWDFCLVVQQLAWLFSSPACFTRVSALAACQSRVTREFQPRVSASLHNLEHFFTLSHSLPLHDSHLNIGLLITKIQANLRWNKANKMVDTIQPYNLSLWLFHDKTLKQTLDLTCELGTVEQNSLTPNSRICEALEPYEQVVP